MRTSINQIKERKGGEKITVLTAYDFQTAKILDGEVDILLVGDSIGMVIYGMESTLPVTLDIMARHGRAVVTGAVKSLVVVDMPFGSYQESPEQAFRNAARLMAESGCHAVKLEGGVEIAATVRFLAERGIPVMGHVGLQPQSFNAYGGFKVQGRDGDSAARIIADAKALDEAGSFGIVIEGVTRELAVKITEAISIPTIGIGAAPECDGQVLVINDLLGLTEKPPKFVKAYAALGDSIKSAVREYVKDVKSGKFPGEGNCY